MKASELIKRLEELKEENGDLEMTCVEQDIAYNASDCELSDRHVKITDYGEKKIHIGD